MADDDYKKQMEEVKKNCPFCKIVLGEIPSRKVYEDDKVLAVLDINPCRKGHVLLLPKEHYPILPLMPPELFSHLFCVAKKLSFACAKATLNQYSNIFIANGAAAGQQSHHFMVHIIPNEHKGGFDIPKNKISAEQIKDAELLLKDTLNALIKNHISKNPSLVPKVLLTSNNNSSFAKHTDVLTHNVAKEESVKQQLALGSVFSNLSIDEIVDVLLKNKEVLHLFISSPEKFKELIPNHPQLSAMFSNVNVDDVIKKLKEKSKEHFQNNSLDEMSFDKVVSVIMDNSLVRDAMLSDVNKFKTLIPQNQTLSKLFSKVSVDDVYRVIKERMGK